MTSVERRTDQFRMPALGADMTEGRVVEWLIDEGATVERGDLVAVVETDKSDIEIEVFEPCTFDEFVVVLGELVQVGEPIARITLAADARPVTAPTLHVGERPARATTPHPPRPQIPTAPPDAEARSSRRISPRARRIAAARGLDLDHIGPDQLDPGRTITGDLVERLTSIGDGSTAASPGTGRTANIRRAIASVMQRSWSEIPHYHVTSTLDLTDVERRLARDNATRDLSDRVVLSAVVNVAIARAAAVMPQVNGWWQSGDFSPSPTVDLGLILSLRTGGIVVPTIQNADQLDAVEMMRCMRDLVERARRGRLRDGDLRPASISVTNLGDRGADSVLGVIHPPQVTLVGVGTPRQQPAVVDGTVVPRLLVALTVTGDHRAHDGLIAARLARKVADLIEELP